MTWTTRPLTRGRADIGSTMGHLSRIAVLAMSVALVSARPAAGQQPAIPDSLHVALVRLTARLDSLERGQCPGGPGVVVPAGTDSVRQALARLSDRLERLVAARCAVAAPTPAAPDTAAVDELAALRAQAAAAATPDGNAPADSVPSAGPTHFVSRQRNGSALNPEISATGDIRLVGSRHGDALTGDAHEFEVALQSTLDPYSSAKIFVTLSQDEIGVEEGYLYYTGLPGRLRADVGLLRAPVGDLNRWHLHALPESEYPLVYRRLLAADGLAGTGLSLYTALPVSLAGGTHEVWLQGTTAEAAPLYGEGRHGTLLGRVQNFWQLSRSTYGQLGVTALGGNSGDTLQSRVLGVDLRLTWRPPDAGTRREVTLRAEGYRLRATDRGVADDRYGMFAGLTWRASQRWILGARYDRVELAGSGSGAEWQLSPTLTWWQSEFVYLRLEGQHHRRPASGTDDRLLLQAVFAMGPHKHETY